jgi:lipopolysaccharide/colanic/teichoic acid biosynthesis glycosyltransferase
MIRLLDIFFSFIAITFLFPFLLILMVVLKLTGEGEIFYLQKRVGIKNEEFKLLKFATMNKDSPNQGLGNLTTKNDPRILPLGKFLRDTKINELPQLLNILKGDMSVIGPRPLVREGYNSYPRDLIDKISKIKPGLSGVASIILRNEEEILSKARSPKEFHSEVLVPYKAKLEIWYDQKKNIKNYLLLILSTILVIFFPNIKVLNLFFKKIPNPPKELKEIFDK